VAALDAWLASDRPGHGAGWVHTTDLVARLVHWLIALALLGPEADAGLRARLAGSAAQHIAHLEARLVAEAPGDPRRSLQLIGLACAGLGWSALPAAPGLAGRALSALPGALAALLDHDGLPRGGALPLVPELLTHGLVLDRLAAANRAPLPRGAEDRLRRAATALRAVLRPDGRVPGSSDLLVEPLLPIGAGDAAALVVAACAARGWCAGPAPRGQLELCHILYGSVPIDTAPAGPLRGDRGVRAFRDAGLVIADGAVGRRASRLLFQLRAGSGGPAGGAASTLCWSVGDLDLLAAPHPARLASGLGGSVAHLVPSGPPEGARLEGARLGQRELVIRAHTCGRGAGGHTRELVQRGGRLVVVDRFEAPRRGLNGHARFPRVRVGWQLGPAWRLRWDGETLVGQADGLVLRVRPDPRLTWTLVRGGGEREGGWAIGSAGEPVPALLLRGDGPLVGDAAIRCEFSLS